MPRVGVWVVCRAAEAAEPRGRAGVKQGRGSTQRGLQRTPATLRCGVPEPALWPDVVTGKADEPRLAKSCVSINADEMAT